jgi:hypothetical protein
MKIFLFIVVIYFSCHAQQTTFQDSLLDHFTGNWILQGTIGGQKTTHDISAQWVLGHQYLQFHEVSREKDTTGNTVYEAIVYFGWDVILQQYSCLWLDVTSGGGLSAQAIGHAERSNNKMAFLFNGKLQSFARLNLSRK